MPEPREAAAITQGCEEDRHGAEPRVDRIMPASQAWRIAGIIGLSGSVPSDALPEVAGSDAYTRAPTPRGVASTTRSRSWRASAASFARSLASPTGSIARDEGAKKRGSRSIPRGYGPTAERVLGCETVFPPEIGRWRTSRTLMHRCPEDRGGSLRGPPREGSSRAPRNPSRRSK